MTRSPSPTPTKLNPLPTTLLLLHATSTPPTPTTDPRSVLNMTPYPIGVKNAGSAEEINMERQRKIRMLETKCPRQSDRLQYHDVLITLSRDHIDR